MKKINDIFLNKDSNLLKWLLGLFIIGFVFVTLYIHNVTSSIKTTLMNKFSTEVSIQYLARMLDNISNYTSVLKNSAEDNFSLNYCNKEKELNHYLSQFDNFIKNFTKSSEIISGTWLMLDRSIANGNDSFYVWYYKDHETIVKAPRKNVALNPQLDLYYFNAFESKKPCWSEVYTDSDINVPMITYSFPLIKNETVFGVAGFDISLRRINLLLAKIAREYKDADLYLITQNEDIVAAYPNKAEVINKKLSSFDKEFVPIKKILNTHTPLGSINSGDNIIIYSYLSNGNYLVIRMKSSEIYRQLNMIILVTYVLFCLITLLSIYVFKSRQNLETSNAKFEQQALFLQNLIDTIPDMIIFKDVNLRYIGCNKFFKEFLAKDMDDIVGKTVYDMYPKILAEGYYKDDLYVINNKQPKHVDRWMKFADGQYGLFDFMIAPLLDNNGELTGVLAIGRDVTERKKFELEAMRAKELAEMASNDKAAFLANMSHEIRTPMNGVIGFIQLLFSTDLSEAQKDLLLEAKKSSESLLVLINDILDFSKIQAGKMQLENISFNLHSAIEDIASMLSVISTKKGVSINTKIYSNVPTKVWGDVGRLKQVLNNIIGNSVKFTEEGEIIISAQLVSEDEKDVKVLFEVSDTGVGIDEVHQQSIFEVFVQADRSTTRKFGGSGLGLPIAKNIIELMNGNISLVSEPEKGSTFSFTVQFEKDFNEDLSQKSPKNSDNSDKVNVLIIGETTASQIAKYYLSENGYNVLVANTCSMAQSVVFEENINIVVIDYDTYKYDEFDIIECKKQHPEFSDISIIMLTPLNHISEFSQMIDNNVFINLLKPVKKSELLRITSQLSKEVIVDEEVKSEIMTFKNELRKKISAREIKILLVEDNETNQKLIKKMLEKTGYSCDIAENGAVALEMYSNNQYDLILMDCQLPVIDGYEATKNIRDLENFLATTSSSHSRIPIIAMTANAMEGDDQKCINAGMDNYISKPIDIDKFFSVINSYLPDVQPLYSEENIADDYQLSENIAQIMKNLNFTEQDAIEILTEFSSNLPTIIADLINAVENEDIERVAKIAHTLKGTSANLRVVSINNIAVNIEIAAKQQNKELVVHLIELLKDSASSFSSQL